MSAFSLSWLDWLTIILSAYVIFECFSAVTNMAGGYKQICQKIKFCLGFSSACALIYYAFRNISTEMQWLIFGVAGTLAAFVWPRMVWRIKKNLEALEVCLNETHD